MKKIIAFFLTIILVCVFSTSVFAEEMVSENIAVSQETTNETISEESEISTQETVVAKEVYTPPSIVLAVNENIAVSNGVCSEIAAPLLVFDRTYVDLYSLAPYLDYSVQWIEDYIGYFKASKNDKVIDFTLVSQWDELKNQKYKFFVKDTKIYVALRDVNELTGLVIAYDKGLITIGAQADFDRGIYGDIYEYDSNDYIYTTYPAWHEYVVNPYQKYSYETMMKDAERLAQMYPDLIKTSSVGKSVEGRDLLLIEFGRGNNKIFVCGTHHAREYISTTYLMYTIDRYAYAYRTNQMWSRYSTRAILDNVTFCIVPMVNPDGVNLVQNGLLATKNPEEIANMEIFEGSKYGYSAWKANVRGVDVNWNYDKEWSEERNKNPRGSTGFNGDRPHTEPETIAVSNYVDSVSFDAFLSMHTQGQVFYWADSISNPLYIQDVIERDTGFTGHQESGTGVGGSFFDYVYRKYNKPTITVELCPYIGNYPYPDRDFDAIWTPAKNVMMIMANEVIYNKSIVK